MSAEIPAGGARSHHSNCFYRKKNLYSVLNGTESVRTLHVINAGTPTGLASHCELRTAVSNATRFSYDNTGGKSHGGASCAAGPTPSFWNHPRRILLHSYDLSISKSEFTLPYKFLLITPICRSFSISSGEQYVKISPLVLFHLPGQQGSLLVSSSGLRQPGT